MDCRCCRVLLFCVIVLLFWRRYCCLSSSLLLRCHVLCVVGWCLLLFVLFSVVVGYLVFVVRCVSFIDIPRRLVCDAGLAYVVCWCCLLVSVRC